MKICCCKCGTLILPNVKNMCKPCILGSSTLLDRIETSMVIETCRNCERYFSPPKAYRSLKWESKELLLYCLGRNKSVKYLNIVDTAFVYTEPHSKVIIIEVKVCEEDSLNVEHMIQFKFFIRNRQCPPCMRSESNQFWNASVQLRQHPETNKRTFWFLEQLVSKHGAHCNASNIKENKNGIDFYFLKCANAIKFVKFIGNFFGIKRTDSNRLISENHSNNTCNNKTSYCIELLPFCKDDIISIKEGKKREIYLVLKSNSIVNLINLRTFQPKNINASDYFNKRDNYDILLRSRNFIKYKVIESFKRKDYNEVTVSIVKKNENINNLQIIDTNKSKGKKGSEFKNTQVNNKEESETYNDYGMNEDISESLFNSITHLDLAVDDEVFGYSVANKIFSHEYVFSQEIFLIRKNLKEQIKLNDDNDVILTQDYLFFLEDIESSIDIFKTLAEPRKKEAEIVLDEFKKL